MLGTRGTPTPIGQARGAGRGVWRDPLEISSLKNPLFYFRDTDEHVRAKLRIRPEDD
jgi:hypothetical protein